MWLMTTVGFFSIVRKPGETDLTVRARVRSDLEALEKSSFTKSRMSAFLS